MKLLLQILYSPKVLEMFQHIQEIYTEYLSGMSEPMSRRM